MSHGLRGSQDFPEAPAVKQAENQSPFRACTQCRRAIQLSNRNRNAEPRLDSNGVCMKCCYDNNVSSAMRVGDFKDKEASCSLCHEVFQDGHKLAEHHVARHNGCHLCKMSFETRTNLSKHLDIHANHSKNDREAIAEMKAVLEWFFT